MLVELLTAITTTIAIRISEHEIEEVAGLSFISGKFELQERSSLVEDNTFYIVLLSFHFSESVQISLQRISAKQKHALLSTLRAPSRRVARQPGCANR